MKYSLHIFACISISALVAAAPVASNYSGSAPYSTSTLTQSHINSVIVSTISKRSSEGKPRRAKDAGAKSERAIQDLRARASPLPAVDSGIARRSFPARSPTPSDWEYLDSETEQWRTEQSTSNVGSDSEDESAANDPLTPHERAIYVELLQAHRYILEEQERYQRTAETIHAEIRSARQRLVDYQNSYRATDHETDAAQRRRNFIKERNRKFRNYEDRHHHLKEYRERFAGQRKLLYDDLKSRAAEIGFHERPQARRMWSNSNVYVVSAASRVTINGVHYTHPPRSTDGAYHPHLPSSEEASLKIPLVPVVPAMDSIDSVDSVDGSATFRSLPSFGSLSSISFIAELPALYHTRTPNQARSSPHSANATSRLHHSRSGPPRQP